jgi:threonyl-tRNA synthetase
MASNGSQNLANLRHSCAHLLAAAVLELWPNAKPTIGPAIENGFYYDFDFGKTKISEEDLQKIQATMGDVLLRWEKNWKGFERTVVSARAARKKFKNNPYKLELIDEHEKKGETITLYKSGDFVDLCRGGHIDTLETIRHYKLTSIAGAYWRGSEKNPMLTRIYGTCFPTQKELDDYLEKVEEAKKNDHRKIGQELELFTISDEIGQGLILWLPRGTIIKEELEKFAKETEAKEGYQRVSTPHIAKESLYHLSGHLPYYAQSMYPPMKADEGNYYLKPMNCPFTHLIYKFKKHAYKQLPIRYAELGTVYRYEKSGELMGLLRVRGMTQNDAHIYCTEEQVIEELVKVMNLHSYYYDIFGLKNYYIELALPDLEKKKEKYFNDPTSWEKAISLLKAAAKKTGVEVIEKEGEAAFYGPKFDFNIKSVTGKEFGASTNQLDFGSGKRFHLTYVAKDGKEKIVPYIIHRAPLGSDERFIGFLIEHFGGTFPVWLSPIQVIVLPISDKFIDYAKKVKDALGKTDIRVDIDERNETLQAKIRDATLQKVPYLVIVGAREQGSGKVAIRTREGKDLGQMPINQFINKITEEIENKS